MSAKKQQKTPSEKIKPENVQDYDEQWHTHRIIFYSVLILIACLAAGSDFVMQRQEEPVHPSFALTKTKQLSSYLPSLRNTRGDAEIYFFNGRHPGGILLVIGGTHPNEPASNVAATLLVENLNVEAGSVIVITRANKSGFTATEPQEAFPKYFSFTNRNGKERRFRIGSRYTNILDGWPDPVVYRHYPSGQILSGPETRNLNRAYPGRENGTLTEMVAYAIIQLVKQERVDLVVDLHEAAPEYPVINAIVAHANAMEVAAMTVVDLQIEGIEISLETSPVNFHGLSHREIGDFTDAKVVLMETTGALQGRIRGVTDAELVINSKDACYHKASELGKLAVDFPAEGIPIEVRVGRHIEAIKALCAQMAVFEPEKEIKYNQIPAYAELIQHGVGFYLK
jgi:hypothetical protein